MLAVSDNTRVPYEIRPLGTWTDPVTIKRRSASVFQATWDNTLTLLRFEAAKLGAALIVLQVDVAEADLRRDGMLRTHAKVGFPGVAVTLDSRHGPLRYATDAYEQRWQGGLTSWQANVRAIALSLEALRAVDRYGVTNRGEQYTGWKQLPAGSSSSANGGFAYADEALSWMRAEAHRLLIPQLSAGTPGAVGDLYRRLARRLHPDAGGSREDWDRLDQAKQILDVAGRL